MEKRNIFIISGTRGSGKTLFINDVYDFLAIFETDIRGFLSKGIFNEEGQKEFVLKVLGSNEEMHLAARHPLPGYSKSGKFYFNPRALEKGKKIINRALIEQSKILIIDEIGPIELDDQVWHSSFEKVIKNFTGILIFSTRYKMIDRVIEKYKIKDAVIEDIETASPRKIGEYIMSILLNLERVS